MKNFHFEVGGIYERADGLRIEILEKLDTPIPGLLYRIVKLSDGRKYHDNQRRGYPVAVTHRKVGKGGVIEEVYCADVLTNAPHGVLKTRSLGIRADIHKVNDKKGESE